MSSALYIQFNKITECMLGNGIIVFFCTSSQCDSLPFTCSKKIDTNAVYSLFHIALVEKHCCNWGGGGAHAPLVPPHICIGLVHFTLKSISVWKWY